MRIVICGGSNTLLAGGWRPNLERLLPQDAEVFNLAIGGTTSATGLMRLMQFGDLREGDIVLWEYALNEYGHHAQGKHNLRVLMTHVEYFIRECARAGAHLLPVILTTRAQEQMKRLDAYRAQLHFTFASHDVPFIDCSHHFRRHFGEAVLDPAHFQDNFHYQPQGPLIEALAAEIAGRLQQVPRTVFHPERALSIDPRRELRLVDQFDSANRREFRTAIISCQTFPFDQELRARCWGRAVAAMVISGPSAAGFEMFIDGERVGAFSTARSYEQRGPRRIVKQISFPATLGTLPRLKKGDLMIRRATDRSDMVVDHTYEPVGDGPYDPDDDALVCLLLDVIPGGSLPGG